MSIRETPSRWFGSESSDIAAYLKALEPGGYGVDEYRPIVCQCGANVFALTIDQDDELGKWKCINCSSGKYITDSKKFWSDAKPKAIECVCKNSGYNIGFGLNIRDSSWIRWCSLGIRCVKCGSLGSPLDWKDDTDVSEFRVSYDDA